MFIRFSALLPIAALAAVVAAAPSALEARTSTSSSCDTGSISCCNQTLSQSDPTVTALAGLLGIVLPAVGGLVGLNCNPITAIGTGSGATCTQQTVCCTGNSFSGLINLACTPINLGL